MSGVFVAIDGPSINIEPDAWKTAHAKGFPAQIAIKLLDANSSCQIPNAERFEAGPLKHSEAVGLTNRLRATDFLSCKEIPLIPGLTLERGSDMAEVRREEQARQVPLNPISTLIHAMPTLL